MGTLDINGSYLVKIANSGIFCKIDLEMDILAQLYLNCVLIYFGLTEIYMSYFSVSDLQLKNEEVEGFLWTDSEDLLAQFFPPCTREAADCPI